MEETRKTEMIAINKWFYFSNNYPMVQHEWTTDSGEPKNEMVPTFLKEIEWNCSFNHMYNKWCAACDFGNSRSYINNFYAMLSAANRRLFIGWVMDNFDREITII